MDDPFTSHRSSSGRLVAFVVWTVWAGMLLAAYGLLWHYGANMPRADDWYMIPYVTGHENITLGWIWQQFGEHRFVVPRLVFVALVEPFGTLRAAMIAQIAVQGALAAGLMLTARRLRGRTSLADVFFPMLLLHWGHQLNLLNAFSINYALVMTLAAVPALVGMLHGTRISSGGALVMGICLLLLPMNGGQGLLVGVVWMPWLLGVGILSWRSDDKGRRTPAVLLLATLVLSVALCGAYFIGYEKPTWLPPHPGVMASIRTALQFLGMGFSSLTREIWPRGSLAAAAIVLVGSLALIVELLRGDPTRRGRLIALCLFQGSMIGWILGVGWGRSCFGPEEGFEDRLVTPAAMTLCPLFFIVELCGPIRARRWITGGLVGLILGLLPLNMANGHKDAHGMFGLLGAAEHDLEKGMSLWHFMKTYAPHIFDIDSPEYVEEASLMLRDARFGPFAEMGKDEPTQTIRLSAKPTSVHQAEWSVNVVRPTGDQPTITYRLPRPTFVWTLRCSATLLDTPDQTQTLQIVYASIDPNNPAASAEDIRSRRTLAGGSPTTFKVWIGESITEVRLELEKPPKEVQVRGIRLAVP